MLGVCYYPEHWPESRWAVDAALMASSGIRYVRIGEFAWSRLEPRRGEFDFAWLRRAMTTLRAHGLEVVLGTPTATPPKWLVDEYRAKGCGFEPVDKLGRPRRFGSRRHYCFSNEGYRAECARVTAAVAEALGDLVSLWQVDNEFGCHNTTQSHCECAAGAFRRWLERRYGSVDRLNTAWGAVFWSMEVASFDAVDPPNLTVTEANPSHLLDWARFSSDQVVEFCRVQTDILRALCPGKAVAHNFMGYYSEFDHFKVGALLDISSWDSYPLGFLPWQPGATEEKNVRFARIGDPDFQGFHHDLYRATSGGRWWVMEQQPGPVNWSAYNAAPVDGAVRMWTWEALAHGAECVSYFRWRQCPFAQEQHHAGLLRPDGSEDVALGEARAVHHELVALGVKPGDLASAAEVALVYDYEAVWCLQIQPQGASFSSGEEVALMWYAAFRSLGVSVDILPVTATAETLARYRLVLVPCVPTMGGALAEALAKSSACVLVGCRTASKTEDFHIPATLPPGASLQAEALPIRVVRVESLRPGIEVPVQGGGALVRWREFLELKEGATSELASTGDGGHPALVWCPASRFLYLAGWPTPDLMATVAGRALERAGLTATRLGASLRKRVSKRFTFFFNYDPTNAVDITEHVPKGAKNLVSPNSLLLPPAGVAVIERS
jgi:beta-galactosidase